MNRIAVLALAGALTLLAAGCDAFGGNCVLGKTGCAIPGRWTLESVDGTAQTGSITISDGQFARDGYLDVPTGLPERPRLMGSYLGTYLNDPDDPGRFDLDFTVTLEDRDANGNVTQRRLYFVDLVGTVKLVGDNRMAYTVLGLRDSDTIGQVQRYPLLRAGTVLTFRRIGG